MNRLLKLSLPLRRQFVNIANNQINNKRNFGASSVIVHTKILTSITTNRTRPFLHDGLFDPQRYYSASRYDDFEDYSDNHDSDSDSDNDWENDRAINSFIPPQRRKPIQKNKLPAIETIPEYYPKIPILATGYPLFPKFMKVFEVSEPQLMKLIKLKVNLNQPYIGVFTPKNPNPTMNSSQVKDLNEINKTGTFVKITEMNELTDRIQIVGVAHRRIQVEEICDWDENLTTELAFDNKRKKECEEQIVAIKEQKDGILIVKTKNVEEKMPDVGSVEYKAITMELVKTIRDIVLQNSLIRENLQQILGANLRLTDSPAYLADLAAAITSSKTDELQAVLDEPDVMNRFKMSLDLLKKEKQILDLQMKIGEEVEENIKKAHRQFQLMEQLKAIKKELGIEKDDKESLTEKFKANLEGKCVPEAIQKIIDEEISKLNYLEKQSSEFSVTRNYLDWLTCLPWGVRTEENLDLEKAEQILNSDHYGMDDIKKRILEFIAVSKLRGTTQGKILCFYGPPGVGKTSIVRSIAQALNREYFRISVGGLNDVAELKGHRRTYVGSMPGQIIQCLKKTKTENPLILIDEIDKIGSRSHQGDPTSALLELLDPEQNANFLDYFMDIPIDLSKVLFICTANILDTIPDPVRDRMELIEMSGYIGDEKIAIAKQYLIPKARKESGLSEKQMILQDDSLWALIKSYCRESGVRNLQKHVEKIVRKVAYKIVKQETDEITVTQDNLYDFVGKPIFTHDRIYEITPPGVVMGLAWTSMGGSTLFIETVKRSNLSSGDGDKKPGSLQLTGHLGDVMKESSQIALTVARNYLDRIDPTNKFLETASLHLHVPEGATKKDGPSAGITIVTAFMSLALNKPIRQNIAMTGEVSLTGIVLPVGGIKEKIIAAKRVGVNCVILPDANRKDFDELPENIKSDLEIHFVNEYSDVYEIVF